MFVNFPVRQPVLRKPLCCLLHVRLFRANSSDSVLKPLWALTCSVFMVFFSGQEARATSLKTEDFIPAAPRGWFGDGMFAIREGTTISIPRDPGAARVARYLVELLEKP